MRAVTIAVLTLTLAFWGATVPQAHGSPTPRSAHSSFRIYLPGWLPSRFRKLADPAVKRYPDDAARFFMRRYGAHGKWVDIFEGRAGCCLDSVPAHRVGPTPLTGGRIAYFSNQGQQFGGLYLFWDQGRTYIAINSPQLSKPALVHIAQSMTRSTTVG